MSERKYNLHDGKTGAAITVRISPRSNRDEISEVLADGMVVIRLAAAHPEAKMNEVLIAFLARVLRVSPSQLEIVAGISGNDKLVTIIGLDKALVQERILQELA